MTRQLPVFLGVLLIVGLTFFQIQMTDRLSGTNVSAEQRAELLRKVPINIGDWHGEDKDIDPNVRQKAGAIGAVSRSYRNSRTGEQVDLWLIVGHARDVAFHTPDVCYPASGFEARASENSLYPMVFAEEPAGVPFFTNTFLKEDVTGQHLVRVFWSWYNSESKSNDGKVVWEAPHNPRWHFGNTRALYKMYFTSMMRDPKETAEQSACVRFAREFMPEVNKALAEVNHGQQSAERGANPAADRTGADSKTAAAGKGENGVLETTPLDPNKAKAVSEAAPRAEATPATASPAADPLFEPPSAKK